MIYAWRRPYYPGNWHHDGDRAHRIHGDLSVDVPAKEVVKSKPAAGKEAVRSLLAAYYFPLVADENVCLAALHPKTVLPHPHYCPFISENVA